MTGYVADDGPITRRTPDKQLTASLKRIKKESSPKSMQLGAGLYYGPMSIAFLFFRLAKMNEGVETDDVSLTARFTTYQEPVRHFFKELLRAKTRQLWRHRRLHDIRGTDHDTDIGCGSGKIIFIRPVALSGRKQFGGRRREGDSGRPSSQLHMA